MLCAALLSTAVSGWTLKCYQKICIPSFIFLFDIKKKIITFSNWFAFNQEKTFPYKGYNKTHISQACTHFMPSFYPAKDIKREKKTTVRNFWHSFLLCFFPNSKKNNERENNNVPVWTCYWNDTSKYKQLSIFNTDSQAGVTGEGGSSLQNTHWTDCQESA